MIPTADMLRDRLAKPGFEVEVHHQPGAVAVFWLVDGELAGRASIRISPEGLIWDEFVVTPRFRDRGLFTTATDFGQFMLEEFGTVSKIARNAHEAAFYRSVCFDDEPDQGPYMCFNASRYRQWQQRDSVRGPGATTRAGLES